jgi:hypothetical protein
MCCGLGRFGECAQRGLFKGVVKRQVDKITRRMKEKNKKKGGLTDPVSPQSSR